MAAFLFCCHRFWFGGGSPLEKRPALEKPAGRRADEACIFHAGVGFLVVNGYTFGANCVERFVNYQSWPFIPGRSFKRYHRAQQPLILGFVVAPQALAFLLPGWLLIAGLFRHVAWVLILASAAGALSTVLIQLPTHRRFNAEGYSPREMRRLLQSDWICKGADLIKLVATIVLLREVVRI